MAKDKDGQDGLGTEHNMSQILEDAFKAREENERKQRDEGEEESGTPAPEVDDDEPQEAQEAPEAPLDKEGGDGDQAGQDIEQDEGVSSQTSTKFRQMLQEKPHSSRKYLRQIPKYG